MITINDQRQQALFDPWAFISPKRRRLLYPVSLFRKGGQGDFEINFPGCADERKNARK